MEKEPPVYIRFPEDEIRHNEACREFGKFLDTQKSVPVGKSPLVIKEEAIRKEKYGIPSEETLRGFEIINGRVYCNVARAVRQLNYQGIITRKQLAETDLENLKSVPRIGPKTFNILILLQNICKTDPNSQRASLS